MQAGDESKSAGSEADCARPVSNLGQCAADISVDHPRVVENYRSAREIELRVGKDEATAEDLRAAMIHHRSLFEELVQVPAVLKGKRWRNG